MSPISEHFKTLDPPQLSELFKLSRVSETHRIFRIPEIIRIILWELQDQWYSQRDRTLLACIFVNHLWCSESSKLVWEHCGRFNGGKDFPLLKHLIAIDKSQQQKYANYIRILHMNNQVHNSEMWWEGQFHTELTNLSFPRLEELLIYGPRPGIQKYYTPIGSPIPYLQPRLKSLLIYNTQGRGCVVNYNELLPALASQSKNLKLLKLGSDSLPVNISPSIISNVFRDMMKLNCVAIRVNPAIDTSLETFLNLSRLPSLCRLETGIVLNDWIERLEPGAFAALRHLECEVDFSGLGGLLRLLPDLKSLIIRVRGSSTDILNAIARAGFSQLELLSIAFLSAVNMNMDDLLLVAENAPRLSVLEICSKCSKDTIFIEMVDNLDDAKMQALAERLPNLLLLQILSDSSRLTERSLISLSLVCPKATSLYLSASIDFKKLIQEVPLGLFKCLEHLFIYTPSGYGRIGVECNDLQSVAEGLIKIMPKLKRTDFIHHTELSNLVCKLVSKN